MNRCVPFLAFLFAGFLSFPGPVPTPIRETKIVPGDGEAFDCFGSSVSLSGQYALVGEYWDNDNGYHSGSAYLFRRERNEWIEEAKLTASDGAVMDYFGLSVSLAGNLALVGADWDDDNGDKSGSAYIFRRTRNGWVEEMKLTAGDGAAYEFFGTAVSVSGDCALVGAIGDEVNGVYSGSAYIFRREGNQWVQEAKLVPSDGGAYDEFGVSVSLSGDYALIGACGDDENGVWSGSAYLFRYEESGWVEAAKLTPADGAQFDYFGASVSMTDRYALVGAKYADDDRADAGSAYLYRCGGNEWVEDAKLMGSDCCAYGEFGVSVCLSGDYALIGARGDDDKGAYSGSAYIFHRERNGWVEKAKLVSSDGEALDHFGNSVSLSGGYALVGADGDDDNGTSSGSAYAYAGFSSGCEFSVTLEKEECRVGEEIAFEVSLHHLRQATVTVPVNAWVEDSGDHVVAATTSRPLTLRFGDVVSLNMTIPLPNDLPVGSYRLLANVGEMKQGVAEAMQELRLVSPHPDELVNGVPGTTQLGKNFPNPFNPSTTIRYGMSEPGHATLRVYNMTGQLVRILVDRYQNEGYHEVMWDGRNEAGATVASGIYVYRLRAGSFVETRKMLMMK